MRRPSLWATLCGATLFATAAQANAPVALVFKIAPADAWWGTILGVLFETVCVWYLLIPHWRKALTAVAVAHLVSGLLGVVPLIVFGHPLESVVRNAVAAAEPSSQTLIGFLLAQLLLPAIDTVIELPVLALFGAPWERRSAVIVYGMNFMSIAVLIWPLLVK
jgi:hypothetical protein